MIRHLSKFALLVCIFIASGVQAQEKLAQTGFQFLSVGVDARATALAEAFTTLEKTSAALFYNPAGIARLDSKVDLRVNQHNWIADIQYISGTAAIKAFDGRFGVFGLSYLVLDYGEFIGTRVAENEQGFIETGTFKPTATAIGLGYGIELSESFSIGAHARYVYQSLGSSIVPVEFIPGVDPADLETTDQDYSKGVVAFDFGTRYETGYRSLVFGMSIRNFSKEIQYEREGFQLPLTFRFGISMNVLDFFPALGEEAHKLYVSVDASHPRAGPEYVSFGGEYIFMNMLAIRGGYVTNHINDASGVAFGFGVSQFGVGIDYSYTPFAVFNDIHRFSIHLAF